MTYRLKLSRRVRADIDALPGHIRQRVRRTIAFLAENPRPETAKALYGELKGYYRIRLDMYRIIYTINDDIVVVEIVRVVKRTSRTYEALR
jgi:mRNA interferase RelE/StbE